MVALFIFVRHECRVNLNGQKCYLFLFVFCQKFLPNLITPIPVMADFVESGRLLPNLGIHPKCLPLYETVPLCECVRVSREKFVYVSGKRDCWELL